MNDTALRELRIAPLKTRSDCSDVIAERVRKVGGTRNGAFGFCSKPAGAGKSRDDRQINP